MWCYEDTVDDYCIPHISLVLVTKHFAYVYCH